MSNNSTHSVASVPTLQERVSIWHYAYARSAFIEAEEWVKRIMSSKGLPKDIQEALFTAIVVTYVRPFTKSRVPPRQKEELGPISSIPPPTNLKCSHDLMRMSRQKLVGHKDAMPAKGASSTPNRVMFKATGPGQYELGAIRITEIDMPVLADVAELCKFYIARCNQELHQLIVPYGAYFDEIRSSGWHEMIMADSPARWLQPTTFQMTNPS